MLKNKEIIIFEVDYSSNSFSLCYDCQTVNMFRVAFGETDALFFLQNYSEKSNFFFVTTISDAAKILCLYLPKNI